LDLYFFWPKKIGAKANCKILESIPVVNFINISQAAFLRLFFCQKLQSQTVIREKLQTALSHKKVAPKMSRFG